MKTVNVGLLGMGTVGAGTYKTLEMNAARIAKSTGVNIKITKVLDKNFTRAYELGLTDDTLTTDPDDILHNPDIDIVVEAIGGIQPATTFMLDAMNHGKHVVTPNKAAVAANYDTLTATAEKNNVKFLFEAAVGGAIPVLNAITTVLQGNEFVEILGILNGTTNYILTQMGEFGLAYDAVLRDAQEKGFAEADPTADVEGIDVANKLCILMALAFDEYIKPDKIPTVGISKIEKDDLELAARQDCKIKLIARAEKKGDKLTYSVKPEFMPVTHPLASVDNEFNAIYLTGNAAGELMFYGRGAGSVPTGSAVVGDIMQIAKTLK